MTARVAAGALAVVLAASLFLPWDFTAEGAYVNSATNQAAITGFGDRSGWDVVWWLAALLALGALGGAVAALRPRAQRPAAGVAAVGAVAAALYFAIDGGTVRWGALLAVGAASALAATLAWAR